MTRIKSILPLPILLAVLTHTAWGQAFSEVAIYGTTDSPNPSNGYISGPKIERNIVNISPASLSGSSSAGLAKVDLYARVGPGVLKASASGAVSSLTIPNSDGLVVGADVNAIVTAASSELMTLTAAGHAAGERAVIRYSYYLPGTFETTTSGSGYIFSSVRFWSGTAVAGDTLPSTDGIGGYLWEVNGGVVNNNLPEGRLITYERSVVLGNEFVTSQSLQLQAQAREAFGGPAYNIPLGSASFNLDFAGSAYWNGVSEVTIDGEPVSNFSLRNDAGISFNDSFAAVPEPGHYAAVTAAGLVAFGLWRRNSRHA